MSQQTRKQDNLDQNTSTTHIMQTAAGNRSLASCIQRQTGKNTHGGVGGDLLEKSGGHDGAPAGRETLPRGTIQGKRPTSSASPAQALRAMPSEGDATTEDRGLCLE